MRTGRRGRQGWLMQIFAPNAQFYMSGLSFSLLVIAVLQSKLRNSGRIEGGDFNLNIMVTYVVKFQ